MALSQNPEAKAKQLANLKPWVKGSGINPGGRPKGLAERCREATRDGADVVQFMLDVLQGKEDCKTADRLEAAKWFADRGFGKAMETTLTATADANDPDSIARALARIMSVSGNVPTADGK